ncbi:MAG: dicarboxylate/amino acid:cation symporter [Candidatus Marinimicrobia bacterium]|nr:dicarboxylate/amino acid:cation symporter [Candidatus Neomarinimicrobiota bacterium]MDD5540735.1 dicarboxylate/amino acid:cation symporter [Candidatus Neomarinimicrobiota bacterium]
MQKSPLSIIRKISLTAWVFLGIIGGIIAGLLLGTTIVPFAGFIGDVFLRLLKMIIVPLIFTSITTGVIGIGGSKNFGRLCLKTIGYYLLTSLVAILTGLALVNLIRPGVGASLNLSATISATDLATGSISDIFLRMIPENPIAAMAQGDILPLIFFSILLGIAITLLPLKYSNTLSDLFSAGFEVMMKITNFVIRLAPIGIFGLIAKITATTGLESFRSIGFYFITVLAGLLFHFFINLPLIILLLGRFNPYRHLKAMSPALLTAFTTSSSSATLPVTLSTAQERAGISNKISSFVLPLGATINMDGTALYECVAAMFIAQAYGIQLSAPDQLIVVFTALLASIGAAGIPMAGLVMMTIVLRAVGLPLEGIGLILAVDRILDMLRTATNVWSDASCALIIAKSEGELDINKVVK